MVGEATAAEAMGAEAKVVVKVVEAMAVVEKVEAVTVVGGRVVVTAAVVMAVAMEVATVEERAVVMVAEVFFYCTSRDSGWGHTCLLPQTELHDLLTWK